MAEPVGKPGRRSGGGSVSRGAQRSRGGRGRGPRAQRSPARCTPDSVLVDLVSDSDEDILEVPPERGAADPVEVPLPELSVTPVLAAPRDDSDSESEGAGVQPAEAPRALVRRRRRLLLDPGEAPVVPVYSGKVKNSLHLIPDHLSLLKLCPLGAEEEVDMADSSSPQAEDPPCPDSPWKKKLRSKDAEEEKKEVFLVQDTSPLPPPLQRTKSRKHTRALQKLREVNKRLQDLRSCLSPKQHQDQDHQSQEDDVVLVEEPTFSQNSRLFQLKIRCRADLVRLPVRMSEPLQGVVDHMAAHLGVSPSRILLLFGETELSPTATPRNLKLGVADIIDCVVLASSPEAERTSQLLQLRVQGKEKHQMLEVSLSPDTSHIALMPTLIECDLIVITSAKGLFPDKNSPLKTLMSRYEEAMGLSGHKLSFFFDGMKLSGKELPSDLGMESGDLIEVWG